MSVKIDHQRKTPSKTLKPGSTVGILGGGQLGRMMALAGSQMGYRFVTLDPAKDSPCGQVASKQIVGAFDDQAAARKLAEMCDVITYEFENVNAGVADMLARESYVPQGSELLYITQHRLREKRAVETAGVKVAPYRPIKSAAELTAAVREFGTPCVLKTCMGGYDGKGQWVIRSEEEAQTAFAVLGGVKNGTSHADAQFPPEANGKDLNELVLEKFVRFTKELSAIAARNPNGEIRVFPVTENIHVDNILHLSIAPARVPEQTRRQAERMAKRIAAALNVVGLIAVEMFLTEDGELFVNELAPRPHNSGHYTMEACQTSQFEQHIRAVCNLPLGPTELFTPAVMVNVLGEHMDSLLQNIEELSRPHGQVIPKIHLYGKKEASVKRKMGHINLLAPDTQKALDWMDRTGIWQR